MPGEGCVSLHGTTESRHGALLPGAERKALTRAEFVREVRKALDAAGIASQHISGHSFRIGAPRQQLSVEP